MIMIRKFAFGAAVLLACAGFVACNSSTYENVEQTASAAVVRSFSVDAPDSVMENIDSVFFSIDLVNGRIFNADSLPVGTDVTALTPKITTLEGASAMELTVTRAGKADTVIIYTGNDSETVDFTNPVKLRVVSPDGLTTRDYMISVNVHLMQPDSLAWDTKATFPLPTSLTAPAAQRTARAGSALYVLTQAADGSCSMAVYNGVDDLGPHYLDRALAGVAACAFPFTPRIDTFSGADDGSLYILDSDGNLHRSTDGARTWAAAGRVWTAILGAYGSEMLGIARDASGDLTVESTAGRRMALPAGMPVDGFSMPVTYNFPMSAEPQLMIVGGRRADGTLSPDTWGFDGSTWVKLSRRPLPEGLEGATLVPYIMIRPVGAVSTVRQSAMLVFGGRLKSGKLSTVTYVSTDFGVNWRKAGSSLQLPSDIPAMWRAQAIVLSTTLSGDIVPGPVSVRARVSRPVESWECPFIYLFGACDATGSLYPTVWRGAINSLTFKPIV